MHMSLEETEDFGDEDLAFCGLCGKQLSTIDERAGRICYSCSKDRKLTEEEHSFFCWACGERLQEMSEVAQGVCHHCKASIIRKLLVNEKKR
jgi:DNA-directed RNA polymerase subunit RPC12/RpoP